LNEKKKETTEFVLRIFDDRSFRMFVSIVKVD